MTTEDLEENRLSHAQDLGCKEGLRGEMHSSG